MKSKTKIETGKIFKSIYVIFLHVSIFWKIPQISKYKWIQKQNKIMTRQKNSSKTLCLKEYYNISSNLSPIF